MRERSFLLTLIALLIGISLGSATATSAAPPSPSPSEAVGQLEISGLDGGGKRVEFEGAVEVRSFDFSAIKSGSKDPNYRRLHLAAAIGKASVGLLERLSQGTSISSVKLSLTVESADGLGVYKTYTLGDAKVVALREYASGHAADTPMMEFSLSYKKMSVVYNDESAQGGITPVGFCWLVVSATKC